MYLKETLEVIKDLVILILHAIYHSVVSIVLLIFPRPKKSLSGRYALVTGAGHGMGRQFAIQLSDLGVKVVCWDIDIDNCKRTVQLVQRRGGEAWAFQCDVSNPVQIAMVAEAMR